MSKPTDDELNRAMAEACGWTDIIASNMGRRIARPREKILMGAPPGEVYRGRKSVPNYVQHHDALPEVWQAITRTENQTAFIIELRYITGGSNWQLLTAAPRQHVEAALHVLGAWKPEWDAPAVTENDPAAEEMDTPPE